MTRFDRFLAREYISFSLLGITAVVVLYDLINLIERMNYFLRYKAEPLQIVMYYVYDLPPTIGLLAPVGFALGVFLVIGRLIRSNELLPLQASGVSLYRIFSVFLAISTLAAVLMFTETELVATRARTTFLEHRIEKIEKRQRSRSGVSNDLKYISETGMVYYIGQLRLADSTARKWMISQRNSLEGNSQQQVARTIYIPRAKYTQEGHWEGYDVEVREFRQEEETYTIHSKLVIADIIESPQELGAKSKEIEEMRLGELATYIRRMRAAGSNVAKELVEFHFRFSTPLILIIVTLISLSAATLLRKGNITLGIGLGLLLSFLYWGSIQASRALGYQGTLSPWLAAWTPNILFFALSAVLLTKVKR